MSTVRLGSELNTGSWTHDSGDWDANGDSLTAERGATTRISKNLALVTGKSYRAGIDTFPDGDGELVCGGSGLLNAQVRYEFVHIATGPEIAFDPSVGPNGNFRGSVGGLSVREIIG